MTLDEAIKMYTSNAEYERTNGSLQGCLEFKQLAEWLKELKDYRKCMPSYEAGYNDAKREIALSGEYERVYERGKADAQTERWIPVSERLPEANGRYLVTRGLNACGALWNRTYIINYSDLMGLKSERIWWEGNVGKSDFKQIDDVIAWMPLPTPYKMESEEKE